MSRIPSNISGSSGSSSGVAGGGVAISGKPVSTVYTVLAIIATLFLLAAIVTTMTRSNEGFGYVVPLGDDYNHAKDVTKADARALKTATDAVNAPFDLMVGMAGHAEGGQPAAAPAVPAAPVAPVAPAAPAAPTPPAASAAAPAPPA